jgi:hypothetical protein
VYGLVADSDAYGLLVLLEALAFAVYGFAFGVFAYGLSVP